MTTVGEVVVHILHHGRALCPQPGVPRDWPRGHKWLSIADVEAGLQSNCPGCVAGHRKMRGLK